MIVSMAREVRCASGVRLGADLLISEAPPRIDTLLVAGRPNAAESAIDDTTRTWLATHAPRAKRYGSVCTGAFALAEAGLLDGLRATTHWAVADELARRFPSITVEADAIHVRDGKVRTSAGVTAGLDLAIDLVSEDLGQAVGRAVAAQLVMFFKRPAGQLQFSRKGEAAPQGRAALQDLQRWVASHPSEPHSVAALAARAGLSSRHLARLFHRELGMTPGEWVEAARIAAARSRLEAGLAPKQVAAECGFANPDSFRRAFQRVLGGSPAQYRRLHGVIGDAVQTPAEIDACA